MLDHWRAYHDVLNAIELQVDAAGDTLYNLTLNYGSGSEDRLRWLNESHDALVKTCDGLHALARVAEEVRSSNRERVIRDQQIATGAGNAPVTDMEGTRGHNPPASGPRRVRTEGRSMSEAISVICDNCGAKPKHAGNFAGWVTTKPRPNPMAYVTITAASYGTTATGYRADLDLCPQCVDQIRAAKGNGYPNAPERVAS